MGTLNLKRNSNIGIKNPLNERQNDISQLFNNETWQKIVKQSVKCDTMLITVKTFSDYTFYSFLFFNYSSLQIKTPPPAEDLTVTQLNQPSKENSGANQDSVGNNINNNTKNIAPKKEDNPTTSALDKRALQPKQGQAKASNVVEGNKKG